MRVALAMRATDRRAPRGVNARTFSNLVVCLTLKCTSELSCGGSGRVRRSGVRLGKAVCKEK